MAETISVCVLETYTCVMYEFLETGYHWTPKCHTSIAIRANVRYHNRGDGGSSA